MMCRLVIFSLETGLPLRGMDVPADEAETQAQDGEIAFERTSDMANLSLWRLVDGQPCIAEPSA